MKEGPLCGAQVWCAVGEKFWPVEQVLQEALRSHGHPTQVENGSDTRVITDVSFDIAPVVFVDSFRELRNELIREARHHCGHKRRTGTIVTP